MGYASGAVLLVIMMSVADASRAAAAMLSAVGSVKLPARPFPYFGALQAVGDRIARRGVAYRAGDFLDERGDAGCAPWAATPWGNCGCIPVPTADFHSVLVWLR